MLEQVVKFTQARHGVLAGNIANIDTPGYKSRDLSVEAFQTKLKEAVEARRLAAASPGYQGHPSAPDLNSSNKGKEWEQVQAATGDILFHDNHDVSLETQVTEIAKNQSQHNLALTIMNAQFRLLRAAVTERA